MATYINGSKPSLNPKDPNLDIEANKKLANINTEGIMENGAGRIYMTQSLVDSTTTTFSSANLVASTSTTINSSCCERVDLVTSVTDDLSTALTAIDVQDNKEEIFLPVVYIDNFGNIKEIVRSSSRNDTYHGTEFVLEPAVDGQNPD
tara:strand:+ start:95 stop:538 length:444 start_codon:yes stop_codon:yes gene_type:complete